MAPVIEAAFKTRGLRLTVGVAVASTEDVVHRGVRGLVWVNRARNAISKLNAIVARGGVTETSLAKTAFERRLRSPLGKNISDGPVHLSSLPT